VLVFRGFAQEGGDPLVIIYRETRERWPLLTVETAANGIHMTGVLPWLFRWACRASTIDFCPALAALVSPVQNIIFFAARFFTLLAPIVRQAGQAVVICEFVTVARKRLLSQLRPSIRPQDG
jgi:hypothetical protein